MEINYSILSRKASSTETTESSSKPISASVTRRPKWQTFILRSIILPLSIFAILIMPVCIVADIGGDSVYYTRPCSVSIISHQSVLVPNVVFGNFTITQARAIDLTWNLGAGRGIQAIMASMTYKVANAALLRLAEAAPLSYRTFEAVSISRLSFSAIAPLARAVLISGGWRAKLTFLVLCLSAVFILTLPTLNDIMTGYIQNSQLYWQFSNGTMAEASDPEFCPGDRYHNGSQYCLNGTAIESVCVPINGYKWGFSYGWVALVSWCVFCWGWAIFGIWVDADRFSVLYRGGRELGTWRAITDLGSALKRDVGTKLGEHSNTELEKEVDAALPVMYNLKRGSEGKLEAIVLEARTSRYSD